MHRKSNLFELRFSSLRARTMEFERIDKKRQRLEQEVARLGKIKEMVQRSNAGEATYTSKEWQDAIEGTNALDWDPGLAVFIERTWRAENIQDMVQRHNAGKSSYSEKA
jgi:hypothetical protein